MIRTQQKVHTVDSKIDENRCKQKIWPNSGIVVSKMHNNESFLFFL